MRPGQNGKRARRGRKPHNMMNRTFDSNGPDVKIRGTAAHIYEKYLALARDAHASGDRVGAENYLQHAEHYYRMLSAYQSAVAANGGFPARGNGSGQGAEGQPFNGQGRGPLRGEDSPEDDRGEAMDDGDPGDEGHP